MKMSKGFLSIWILSILVLLGCGNNVFAQPVGQLNGDFQTNFNIYQPDSLRGTTQQQYFNQKSSAEAWLFLNYRYSGYTISARFDLFNNSALLNPQESFTGQGIGIYSITKTIGKLTVTGGHFYDQFGSGAIFRAFEDRTLGLDYAVQGVRVQFDPSPNTSIKAFTGQQRFRFGNHPQTMRGVNIDHGFSIFKGKVGFQAGAGLVNRTLDRATVVDLANTINSLPLNQRFDPKFNVLAGTIYNTLSIGNLSIYTEYARKSREAVFLSLPSGEIKLFNADGSMMYGVANYSFPKLRLGISVQYKKVDSLVLRTSPYTQLLVGTFNFLPPLSRQIAYRLPARYSISAQAQGEEGVQGEITFSPTRFSTITANASQVNQPGSGTIYREYYLDYLQRYGTRAQIEIGIQSLIYDQEIYEQKPEAAKVNTITPLAEVIYRFKKKIGEKKDGSLPDSTRSGVIRHLSKLRPSVRFEAQYLITEQDRGDFAFGLAEFNLAPYYSIAISDMVNTRPTPGFTVLHYPTYFIGITRAQTRFTVGYIKQVAGVVCTGGVCRVEPAFSGIRFTLTTTF